LFFGCNSAGRGGHGPSGGSSNTGGDFDYAGGTSTQGGDQPVTSYDPSILVLDFRSGWWAGSAGNFHQTVLGPLRDAANNITIEFHHLTVGSDVKCVYAPGGMQHCQTDMMSQNPTPAEVVARFDHGSWNSYTQVWILSGSEKDMSDIRVSGDLFGSFIQQAGTSCIPLFIGAGDGFIDHANALASSLGIGTIMSTQYASPGFFFGSFNASVDSTMKATTHFDASHVLFDGVTEIADGIGNFLQHTHGDALVGNPMVTIVAHDNMGQATIGYGQIQTPDGQARPFVFDSGMQRYYGSPAKPDTLRLLLNIRKYLSSSGCRAVIQ
jgi:hypothetical protein